MPIVGVAIMMLKIIQCVEPIGSIVDQDNFLSDYIAYYINSIAHFHVCVMNGKFLCIDVQYYFEVFPAEQTR